MRPYLLLSLMCACSAALGQHTSPEPRRVDHFEITEQSRLVALAKLGAATKTSLLVEGGDMRFLAQPVTFSADHRTVEELIVSLLRGPEHYTNRRLGALVVVYPTISSKPINRILNLPLGPFSFKEKSISSLDPLISFQIRLATGCHPQGYMWAGPTLDLDIPPFSLKSATFEGIIEQVAKAPEPTMWVVVPDAGKRGCIDDPMNLWEVGFYNYDANHNQSFTQSSGPFIVR
jgi:hypothetical protein